MRLLPKGSPVGWLPYSWLIYLSLYVVYPILTHASAGWLALYGAGLLVFLPLYFRGFWLEGPRLLPVTWGIVTLGVLLIPSNAGASVFFIYAAGFAADVGRPGVALRWLLAIVGTLVAETVIVGLPLQAWVPGVVISLMVGGGNIYFAEKRRADSRLRLAQEEVERLAKVAERERIARDLSCCRSPRRSSVAASAAGPGPSSTMPPVRCWPGWADKRRRRPWTAGRPTPSTEGGMAPRS
jgi:two-component system sensor histidine kinase DesK